jgi:hypothetical protein
MDSTQYVMDNTQYLAIACIIVPVLALGMKRVRERAQELHAAYKVRRVLGRKKNVHRMRGDVMRELYDISDDTFERMFRMPKQTFKELEISIAPILREQRRWTQQSQRMAVLSSGSAVQTILLLAATIRLCVCVKLLTFCTNKCNRTSGGLQEDPCGTLRSCCEFIALQLRARSIACVQRSIKFLSRTSSFQPLTRGLHVLLRASEASVVAEVESSPT